MFSGRRRRRKSSPSASDQGSSSNGRWHSSGTSESSSLAILSPTAGGGRRSFSQSTLPTHHHYGGSPSANTCNNFLLGGHYYPGKDKKRRHLRRRTCWHRTFCSSPSRVICSTLVLGYVLLWHVFVPTTNLLLDYGRILSGRAPLHHRFPSTNELVGEELQDSLRPLQQEKLFTQRLRELRQHYLDHGGGMEKRMKLYEIIVPEWFHIYHPKSEHDKQDGVDSVKVKKDGDNAAAKHDKGEPQKKTRSESKDTTGRQKPKAVKPVGLEYNNVPPQNADAGLPRQGKTNTGNTANNQDANQEEPSVRDKDDHASGAVETPRRILRTLLNMDTREITSSCPTKLLATDINTTLIVQSSLERVWILEETCSRWKDPIVAVVYLKSTDISSNVTERLKDYETKFPHLRVITHEAPSNATESEYPVNVLRNTGLDAVKTSHVLVADIDFVPSVDLQDVVRSTLQELQAQQGEGQAMENSTALVVPAFERVPPEPCQTMEDCAVHLRQNSSFIPHSFEDLRTCVREEHCSVFQQGVNWEGHYSTHSESWLKGNFYQDDAGDQTTRRIKTIKCLDSLRYEPYIVLRWCPASESSSHPRPVAPYYDERFHGYGKNKIQLVSHVRFMGYSFRILPHGFIVHNPHPESKVKETWNNVKDFDLHAKMDKLYPQFLNELWSKYSDRRDNILWPCDDKKKK